MGQVHGRQLIVMGQVALVILAAIVALVLMGALVHPPPEVPFPP
jgi:hypothetical protein